MPTRTAVQMYALGVRLQQALILASPSDPPESLVVVHGAMNRLLSAAGSLTSTAPNFDALRQRLISLVTENVNILERTEPDYLLESYRACFTKLRLFEQAARNSLEDQREASSTLRTWFVLGLEITDGWGDDGSRVPGRPSRPNQPWQWQRPEALRQLVGQLSTTTESLFPCMIEASPSTAWVNELPPHLYEWGRIEIGLERLAELPADASWEPAPTSGPDSPQLSPLFLHTPLQKSILDALNGKALKKQPLADKVAGGDASRLYKKNGLKELRKHGFVDHKNGVGYYRPDAPPPS